MSWIETVNQFWFEELGPNDWFGARPEIDATIRTRFSDLRDALKHNPPHADDLDADGHVAAVIVFDQFSRNLFRRSPEAYATDGLALNLARHAVDLGMDKSLGPRQQQFLYMPFMHSEERAMQARSVALFTDISIPGLVGYAEHHRDVIDRFGRFPHRNAMLGRMSTAAEREFLGDGRHRCKGKAD